MFIRYGSLFFLFGNCVEFWYELHTGYEMLLMDTNQTLALTGSTNFGNL
jgi:hypothetical protein